MTNCCFSRHFQNDCHYYFCHVTGRLFECSRKVEQHRWLARLYLAQGSWQIIFCLLCCWEMKKKKSAYELRGLDDVSSDSDKCPSICLLLVTCEHVCVFVSVLEGWMNMCGQVQLPHTRQREGSWMGEGSCWQRRTVPPPVSKTHADGSGSTTAPLKKGRR